MSDGLPRYHDLPAVPDAPPHSAWGLWGREDAFGALNLLTPERVVEAAKLVRRGAVFPLNWDLDLPDPAVSRASRGKIRHTYTMNSPHTLDDVYDNFFPQASSQWDAFSHAASPTHGFYNWGTREQSTGAEARNGIHHWAQRGIAGRAVLLDVGRWLAESGRDFDYDDRAPITVADLESVISEQGVEVRPGDVLLVRTGWMKHYLEQDRGWRQRLARRIRVPGLESCEAMAEFLWNLHVSAVAADNYAVENFGDPDYSLHANVLALLGIPLGEFWFLEELAADCASDRCYEAMLTSAPLNKRGGSGSPPNAIAIK